MSYWKLGDRYAYITNRGTRGIVDKLSQVPASAKQKTSAKQESAQKSSPKKKRRTKKLPKKKKTSKGGFRLPGGLGPKGILTGILGMTVIPQFIPVTSPGAAKLGTGLVLRALKLGGGGALSSVGIMELAAEFIGPALGRFGLGNGNGASGGGGSGGYDY